MAEPESTGRQGRPLLVLGSASPARAALLRAAGITPIVQHSRVDEEALVSAAGAHQSDAPALTQMLAGSKARDVADQVRAGEVPGVGLLPGRRVLVVGADSLLAFDGRALGKAHSAQEVRDRWSAMAGGTGVLHTGHCVICVDSGRTVERTVATTIRFGRPDEAELEAYIASGEPLAVAGSCTIDGLGGAFIEGVDGDHTNVIGLALPTLRALLAELGIRWTDLWDIA